MFSTTTIAVIDDQTHRARQSASGHRSKSPIHWRAMEVTILDRITSLPPGNGPPSRRNTTQNDVRQQQASSGSHRASLLRIQPQSMDDHKTDGFQPPGARSAMRSISGRGPHWQPVRCAIAAGDDLAEPRACVAVDVGKKASIGRDAATSRNGPE